MVATTADRISLTTQDRAELEVRRTASNDEVLWSALDGVMDPEIPNLSIWDLGILQDVCRVGDDVRVVITPTYSGCPAMAIIESDIVACLTNRVTGTVSIEKKLSPAWTTDWMTPAGREKLHSAGVAAPQAGIAEVICPVCEGTEIEVVSEFSTTACQALLRCRSCGEPFQYFKSF